MTIPKDLTRFERWLCEIALRAEESGPLGARVLPLLEGGLGAGIVALSLYNITPENMVGNALGAALAGAFVGIAIRDLLWPRNQRLLALLYRACLEDRSEGERERAAQA